MQVDGNPSFAGIGRTINAFDVIFTRLTVHIQGIYAALFFRSTVTNGLTIKNIIQLFNFFAVVGHMVSTIPSSTQYHFAFIQITNPVCNIALIIFSNILCGKGCTVIITNHQNVVSIFKSWFTFGGIRRPIFIVNSSISVNILWIFQINCQSKFFCSLCAGAFFPSSTKVI